MDELISSVFGIHSILVVFYAKDISGKNFV